MNCDWIDCENEGTLPLFGTDGAQWACLCVKHNRELDTKVADGRPGALLSAWICAQGGAKRAAERMTGKQP